MSATMTVEEVERGLIAHGVPRDKARSVALQQAGIFVTAPQPFTRKPSVKEPVSIPASDPDAGRWELWLPMPGNIANGSHGHWSARHKAKEAYWATLDLLPLTPPPAVPLKRATLSSVMYLGHAMDDSNAMRRHKHAEDWLVTRGYIADDKKACLTWLGFPTQIVSRRHVYGVHLTLTARYRTDMGTLYYFVREDSQTMFALNKSYQYERYTDEDAPEDGPRWSADFAEPTPVRTHADSPAAFAEKYITHRNPEWGRRIGERLFRWAGDAPIRYISEHDEYEYHQRWGVDTYEDGVARITGSAHDSDYEDDGTTYKPLSAW